MPDGTVCKLPEEIHMVKIVIKGWDAIYKETVHAIKHRIPQKEDKIIYIESLDDARKLFTPERIKFLSTVREESPESLYALAKLLKKDFKTISTDARLLSDAGILRLVNHKAGKRTKVRPVFTGNEINLSISV